ncbi:MAG: bifunctional 4-hydroxy-2-oxoglutarate aldolase/2-dehydro-3-deoxy-phosphogluconate aldolase [Treponema sp.]|jgi:2-dehydro-3-deoxyphosphogluconate aldolase/(4S)-4-hydroxy-2-oxoglutarate aldolase|nr:bifunctional 4-hydroxy-2-oxoglutarate aldolase/2-dehydro-3-deoxy-phosphogluconate aldolase [Treponema sp.]
MHQVLEDLRKIGIIPVIKIDDVEKAVPLAKALIAGGIPCAEITFRTAQGEEAIRRIKQKVPEILLGAGTVLTEEQVDKAVKAGAAFIVSPGFNPKILAHCIEKGIPITPGCSSPTDIEQALSLGLEAVKFFPAEQAGGLQFIKAVAAPYSSMMFIPTGGISSQNIAKYTAYEKILACGGSWMVNPELINAGDFERITALCKEAVLSMLNLSVVHIGINASAEDEALKAAKTFETIFGFAVKSGNSSIFASDGIEIMKTPGLGKNGHIAVGTTSVYKAAAYLDRQGIALNKDSLKTDAKGEWSAVYLKEEILGFAIHLVQKK